MRAWQFQDSRQKAKLGSKCPWSVGWYEHDGRKKSKKVGSKSTAEKFKRQIEAQLSLGLVTDRRRTKWAEFRQQLVDLGMTGKAEGTAKAYEDALDSFERIVKPVYMDSIETSSVDAFKAKRTKERAQAPIRRKPNGKVPADRKEAAKNPRLVSPATVNKELRHIRAALRKAKKWKMLKDVPDFEMLREPQRDPYFISDDDFAKLYDACPKMTLPANRRYPAADWWKALLCFAYMTGWRIGEILELRREDLDLEAGIAKVDAGATKGRRDARIELHPVVIEHLRSILDFQVAVFDWPHHPRTLWEEFTKLKTAAGLTFAGAFHRFRFGFANANVDSLDPMILQKLMRHQSPQTTRGYINMAERLKRTDIAERLHVPAVLKAATG